MLSLNAFGYNARAHRFVRQYECYPVAMLPGNEREDVERGGKIMMPSSALEELTQLNISYPMLFRLSNAENDRVSHCGVLEFVADEGRVYLPRWMMNNLRVDDGDVVYAESTELPIATYAKFQPQSADFLDITDSKAVLENTLRNFACLTTGDCIAISYNRKVYEVCVLETRPDHAVCIIECDMSVEYVAPVGYEEPADVLSEEHQDLDSEAALDRDFVAFSGRGNILVGRKKKKRMSSDVTSGQCSKPPRASATIQRGVPDYSYTVGVLKFFRSRAAEEARHKGAEGTAAHIEPFSGPGHHLKPPEQTHF